MSQLYEKKCDCRQYDQSADNRSAPIKMDVAACKDNQLNSTSHIIFRALRFIGYVIVLILSSYLLWRILITEFNIQTIDIFFNYTKKFESSNYYNRRVARSIKASANPAEHNSFDYGGKELARGAMLTSKNENPQLWKKKPAPKDNFDELMKGLFDKIWEMHNDTDRSHFDNNMKAVFQAWFPVFDALLPHEFMESESIRNIRSADEIGNGFRQRVDRKKREVDKRDKSHMRQHKNSIQITQKLNEELLRRKAARQGRSVENNSEETLESVEERNHRVRYIVDKNKKLSNEPSKRYLIKRRNNGESAESSEFERKMKNKANSRLMYQIDSPNQNDYTNEVAFG
ncbi:PREDICTED: uncharacterized protein LOC105367851 [Ceratosolen solmsi marchali]|uniref:Uncharacterized protein LOC105367851 n=1 Tax=Ceratosolen solmsi marchali TaxID=326594 RepID=A0AAJ6YV27_9HYME|nr:PREDICTED: uncharacterized protein LOC105367851 [Ceratosolen solmsi marchali]